MALLGSMSRTIELKGRYGCIHPQHSQMVRQPGGTCSQSLIFSNTDVKEQVWITPVTVKPLQQHQVICAYSSHMWHDCRIYSSVCADGSPITSWLYIHHSTAISPTECSTDQHLLKSSSDPLKSPAGTQKFLESLCDLWS